MTLEADLVRSRRRAFAAPGGAHDRLIQRLSAGLAAGVGATLAVMVVAPLFPHGDVSFLLDRNKVTVTTERLRVSHALYRGEDNQGRAFSVSAGSAVQHSLRDALVEMRDMVAHLQLADGPAEVSAPGASYNIHSDSVMVAGPVNFTAAGGYRMETSGVAIDLRTRRAFGAGGVRGVIPAGTFSADRVSADLAQRNVMLDGHARLRMVPGQLRMPK